MNLSAIVTLLQLVVSLLTGVQNNASVSQAATAQTVAIASRAIQFSAQAIAAPKVNFAVPLNSALAPNITDLYNAAYLDAAGNYVPAKNSDVGLVAQYTSFGDLNGDGLDDAAAIVQRTDSAGNTTFSLAAMLNQGGVMFNIADLPLGPDTLQINSHNVVAGGNIVINMQNGTNGIAQTSTYQLFGDQLMKL